MSSVSLMRTSALTATLAVQNSRPIPIQGQNVILLNTPGFDNANANMADLVILEQLVLFSFRR
jgi:hypothetical protein